MLCICNLKENSMEMLHLPRTDALATGGLLEVIEWAHEHKDEQFIDPKEQQELNMGHRMFKYITSLFNSNKKI